MDDELTPFERALVLAVLEEEDAPAPRRRLDADAVRAAERSMSDCGVITDLCDSDVCRIYDEGTSLRLGAHTIARLNGHEDVCLVVYVDDGKITALEACTFGGRPWPHEVREFVIEHVQKTESGNQCALSGARKADPFTDPFGAPKRRRLASPCNVKSVNSL